MELLVTDCLKKGRSLGPWQARGKQPQHFAVQVAVREDENLEKSAQGTKDSDATSIGPTQTQTLLFLFAP